MKRQRLVNRFPRMVARKESLICTKFRLKGGILTGKRSKVKNNGKLLTVKRPVAMHFDLHLGHDANSRKRTA